MSDEIVDEVVDVRPTRGGSPARRVFTEAVDEAGTSVKTAVDTEDQEVIKDFARGRKFKESTKALLDKLAAAPVENTGDPIEGEPSETAEASAEAPAGEEATSGQEQVEAAEPKQVEPADPANEWRTAASRLEATNRQLLAELEAARKQPPAAEPSTRLKALEESERAYVDESPVVALRRWLGAVLDAPHDSKLVDAELSGLFTDLSAQEINVPLEPAHKASRDAALARLALARDKRERKAESEAKQAPVKETGDQQIEQAAALIENRMVTKTREGTSLADDFPMLMNLAETLDGMKPQALVAKVIQHEIKIGTLDPTIGDDNLIKAASQMIETHYQALADKLSKAKPQKTDTTKSGDLKTATAPPAKQEQRQGTATRTISNATASVAPATSPQPKQATPEKPKYKNEKARRDAILDKYFPKG